MTHEAKNQKNLIRVRSLYDVNPLINVSHMFAGSVLIYLLWNHIPLEYKRYWGAGLLLMLLVSVLLQSRFQANSVSASQAKKWETSLAVVSCLIGSTFSLAYAYSLFVTPELVWSKVIIVITIHLSATAILYRSSMKSIILVVTPIALTVLTSLMFKMTLNALEVAAVFMAYIMLLSFVVRGLNDTFQKNLAIKIDYDKALEQAKKYKHALESASFKDSATNVFNRRFFNLIINNELRRAKRSNTNLSLTLIEMDGYARYTDHYGRDRADECLKLIARKLNSIISRGGEYIYRFDKCRFALILPNTSSGQAMGLITKIVHAVQLANIKNEYSPVKGSNKVTVSIGVSDFKAGELISVESILEHTLNALKRASENGGDEIKIHEYNQPESTLSMTSNTDDFADSAEKIGAESSVKSPGQELQSDNVHTLYQPQLNNDNNPNDDSKTLNVEESLLSAAHKHVESEIQQVKAGGHAEVDNTKNIQKVTKARRPIDAPPIDTTQHFAMVND